MAYSSLFDVPVRVAFDTPTNPTTGSVWFAFTTSGNPVTWFAGTWESTPLSTGEWAADVAIGPTGATTLTPGQYTVWVALGATVGTGWGEPIAIITVT